MFILREILNFIPNFSNVYALLLCNGEFPRKWNLIRRNKFPSFKRGGFRLSKAKSEDGVLIKTQIAFQNQFNTNKPKLRLCIAA